MLVSASRPLGPGSGVLPWIRRDAARAYGQVPASRHQPLPHWFRRLAAVTGGTALEPLRVGQHAAPAPDGLDGATRTLLELARTAAAAAAAVTPAPLLPDGAVAAMAALAGAGLAANTEAARASDWAGFTRWCATGGHVPLPAHPLLVRWYVTAKAAEVKPDGSPAYAPATLTRWVATINAAHTAVGLPRPGRDEGVTQALSAIRRVRAAPPRRRAPLLTDDVRALLTAARTNAHGGGWAARVAERRDSCLLLFGLAGALRRSELVGLTVADVTPSRADGLVLTLRRSKTDQQAAGRTVTLPYGIHPETCPVCAHVRWREVLDAHTAGTPEWMPLLRTVHRTGAVGDAPLTGQAVAHVVRRRAAAAGFGPELVARLGGHSLRVGFVTQAVRNGASTQTVMAQTGHTDERMVSVYARRHAGLIGNAVTHIGL